VVKERVVLKEHPEAPAHPLELELVEPEDRPPLHPNVARVYDIAEAKGLVFISMEYVDGEDLASVLRRMGRPGAQAGPHSTLPQ